MATYFNSFAPVLIASLIIFASGCQPYTVLLKQYPAHNHYALTFDESLKLRELSRKNIASIRDPLITASVLYVAVRTNDLQRAKQCLELGINPNARSEDGSVLELAIHEMEFEMVSLLINFKADVNAKGSKNTTPLIKASGAGSFDVVQLLIAHGARVNDKDDHGVTPLLSASISIYYGTELSIRSRMSDKERTNYFRIIEELIKKGANVNSRDDEGYTSLSYIEAAVDLDPDLQAFVELLIRYHASKNYRRY